MIKRCYYYSHIRDKTKHERTMKKKALFAILIFLSLVAESCHAPYKYYHSNGQAYFCFADSTGYVNFNDFITKNIIMSDNGVDANVLCLIEFEIISNGKIEDIQVTSDCNFCNAAVTKAVEMSGQYWKLKPLTHRHRINVHYEYKYMIR